MALSKSSLYEILGWVWWVLFGKNHVISSSVLPVTHVSIRSQVMDEDTSKTRRSKAIRKAHAHNPANHASNQTLELFIYCTQLLGDEPKFCWSWVTILGWASVMMLICSGMQKCLKNIVNFKQNINTIIWFSKSYFFIYIYMSIFKRRNNQNSG